MTFVYPAVFTPHEKDNGFHVEFPDLECCEADGPDLEDAVENARDAARNWITAEGMFIKNIMVIIKLLPDND